VLGIHAYGHMSSTLRLQVRTAPMRQEEVSRELRRRVQMEFQRQNIAMSPVQSVEHAPAFHSVEDLPDETS
jgi:ABC-type glutathione transport system ATPase component